MIVLGLGSSGPEAISWLRKSVAALKQESDFLRIITISPLYESDAMMPEGAPASWNVPYLNLALRCEIGADSKDLKPLDCLARLKDLEKKIGRLTRARWAPREIDIDILAWQGVKLESERLSIPHHGLPSRPFALLPLSDVAQDWLAQHPDLANMASAWRRLPETEVPYRTRKSNHRLTELVAILNLTPDSFSDGGKLLNPETIAHAAHEAVRLGATVLDLGAESTRPGAVPVHPEDEWRRLLPALEATRELRAQGLVQISIDSRHPETIERALNEDSLDWINDVTGFENPAMRELARDSKADLVFMHSLGIPPRSDATLPADQNAVDQVLAWARGKISHLEQAGIARSRLILDPGIGFGKTPGQNLELLRGAHRFHELGLRVLVGHSRKSFLAALLGAAQTPAKERDLETALVTAQLADQGIEFLRVHDVASQMRALQWSARWDGKANLC